MNRKERRELERKVRHIQKTKPWELQAMIRDQYPKEVIENRIGKDTFAPGDKVMLDVQKVMDDINYGQMKQEYKEFIQSHANEVFTLSKVAKMSGPFAAVSFEEDETDPKWMFFIGHLKKVNKGE